LRNFLDPDHHLLVVSDSGGAEVATRGIEPDPHDVLAFQETNADIGMIVDHPPMNYEYGINFPESHFLKCLKRTKENAQFAARNRTKESLTLLNVLQGRNVDQMKKWYDEVKDVSLDGYALAPKPPGSPEAIARYCLFTITEGLEGHIHVFCGTGKMTMPIIVWVSKYIKRMTFDSASWTHLGSYKRFLIPQTMESPSVKGEIHGNSPPCWCPMCQVVDMEAYREDNDLSRKLLALHNLYTYISYYRTLVGLRDSYDEYIEVVSRVAGPEVVGVINMIEKGVEENDYHVGLTKQGSIKSFFGGKEEDLYKGEKWSKEWR